MNTKFMFKYLRKLPGKWFLPIIAAIWVIGIGFRWISQKTCIVLTIVIVAVWLLYLLLRWYQGRGGGEEAVKVPGLEGLDERLLNAVKSAKSSPWYLFIGPKGCGKTSLLRNSALDFSYIDSLQQKPVKQGIEETKNCDLFFTKQGIVLDTSGRYVTFGNEAQISTQWLGLLSMLKRHRKVRPIDGLILAIDADRLLQAEDYVIQEEAKTIRNSISEIITSLGITFPVYLVFTKCDVIRGFSQFFGGLNPSERGQIWGSTLRNDQQGNPEVAFREECDQIYQSLNSSRLARLGSADKPLANAIYTFPMEFEGAYKKLSPFIGALFPTVSAERPMFRGFYFTSAVQDEKASLDFVMEDIAKSIGGKPAPIPEAKSEKTGEGKGYFIRDLFSNVVFPDKGLYKPTSAAGKRSRIVRLSISAGLAVIFAILAILFIASYSKDKRLMSETQAASISVIEIDNNTRPMEELDRFEKLHKFILRLERSAFFSFPWRAQRNDMALAARKIYMFKRYGDSKGASVKLNRKVEIPVKVFKSQAEGSGPDLIPIGKVDVKAVVDGKEYLMRTNKEGLTSLKVKVKDGKVDAKFSTDYQEPGYEPQGEQVFQIQPGDKAITSRSVEFIYSKSGRVINVHVTDESGADLKGVPVSMIDKTDESAKHEPQQTDEQGVAQFRFEAPEDTVLLIYYGDSSANYPADQSDTVKIESGKSRYSLERQLRRKVEISVMAFTASTDESEQQAKPGVSVSVGGVKLGITDNSGQWSGFGIVPDNRNTIADPPPQTVKIDKTVSGYSILLEYGPRKVVQKDDKKDETTTPPITTPPPAKYLQAVTESNKPISDLEAWIYLKEATAGMFGSAAESDRMEFKSSGKNFRLVRIGSYTNKEGRLKLPSEADGSQILLCHPSYWPNSVDWKDTSRPIRMMDITLERSFSKLDPARRDGAEHYYEMAKEFRRKRELDKAVDAYDKAIRLSPRLKYYLDLAWAHFESNQKDESLKQVKMGLGLKLLDDPEANEKLLRQQLQELLDNLQ